MFFVCLCCLHWQALPSLANPSATHVVRSGMNERCVTNVGNARAGLVFGPLRVRGRFGHLRASGVSPLSLLTFFAAAKKVSAAPHRGDANRPITKQGEANAPGTQPKRRKGKKRTYFPYRAIVSPSNEISGSRSVTRSATTFPDPIAMAQPVDP